MKHSFILKTKILRSLSHAISKDECRHCLRGFNVRQMDGYWTFTATNGMMLVSIQGPLCDAGVELDVILPPIIPKGEQVVTEIDTEAKTVTYKTAHVSTYALIDAKYPAFEKVIPVQVPAKEDCMLNLSKLEGLIKSAKAYAPKEYVFLSPNKKEVNILAIQNHPEWFGILMPASGQPDISIPKWLKSCPSPS